MKHKLKIVDETLTVTPPLTPVSVENLTDNALVDLSVAKWQTILNYVEIHGPTHVAEALSPHTCALCAAYFFHSQCQGCPIAKRVNDWACEGTPFEDAHEEYEKGGGITAATARAEVQFLQSLKKPPTKYLYYTIIQGNYDGRGWEDTSHYEGPDREKEAVKDIKEYRFGARDMAYRIIRRRVLRKQEDKRMTAEELYDPEIERLRVRNEEAENG